MIMKPLLVRTVLLVFLAGGAGVSPAAPPYQGNSRKKQDDFLPAGSASYRPAASGKDKSRPDKSKYPSGVPGPRPVQRPVPLPEPLPGTRPATKPGSLNGLPSQGGNGSRPSTRPAYPEPGRPSTRPAYPEPGRPSTRPAYPEPGRPSTKPAYPEPGRPSTKPAYPKPGRPDDDFLNIRPVPLPAKPDYRPGRPSAKPWPVQPGINLPKPVYPVHRPVRPVRPPQVHNVWENHTHVWNQWTVQNNITINNFVVNRPAQWGTVHYYGTSGDCWKRWNQPDWWKWRRDLWEYRRNRCYELWNAYYWVSDQLFDLHWWSYCPWAANYARIDQVPAWWWWNPVTWEQLTAHVKKLPREQEPLSFDPGVSVIIQNGRVYRNGRDAGSAWKFVESARREANPDYRWEPPFPGGRHEWLPLGVWALTQEEQGQATMFLQLSISRDGLISGGFTNVQTGEDLPVKGGTNREEQRVAFHIGNRTDTVIECGLSHLTQDIAGAFIHYADGNSQTWLLVRLPSPGVPPRPVQIPYLERR